MKNALAILLIMILTVTLLTACSLNPLVGTWSTTIDGAEGVMILNKDGTGEIISHALSRPCTWSVEENKLTVVQDVNGIPYTFLNGVNYERKGKTLTVTSGSGNTLVFEKK